MATLQDDRTMARRPPAEEDDVSLFPFLSIICAIIGVLTLMIAAVTLGQMNQDDVKEAVENAIAMEQIQKELAAAEDVVAEMTIQLDKEKAKLLDNAGSRQNELVKTRAELEALIKQLADAKKKTEEQKKIKIVIPEIPNGRGYAGATVHDQRAARPLAAKLGREEEAARGSSSLHSARRNRIELHAKLYRMYRQLDRPPYRRTTADDSERRNCGERQVCSAAGKGCERQESDDHLSLAQ